MQTKLIVHRTIDLANEALTGFGLDPAVWRAERAMGPLMGYRFETIIVLWAPQRHESLMQINSYLDWLNHLRCKVTPGGTFIQLG